MKQLLILLVAVAAIQCTLAEVEQDEFKCKSSAYKVYADPQRCDRFYVCSKKIATLHTCSGNRLFNTVTKTCAVPALVLCGNRPRPDKETTVAPATTTTTEAPTTPETPTTPQTPDDDFQCNTYLFEIHSDPKHCDKYYTCNMKKATQHTCPMNLLFNSFTRTCAVSALVSCGDRERPGQETTVSPTTTTTTTTEAPTTPETPTTPQTPDDDFQCNTYLFGRHTDPKHCDKYYTCYMKKATQHTCPMNLLFNSFTRTCAVSALVSCGDRERPGHTTTSAPTTIPTSSTVTPSTTEVPTTAAPSTTEVPTTATPSTTEVPTTAAPTTTEVPTTDLPPTSTVNPDCKVDGYFPVLGDCNKFYVCHNGLRYDQHCSDGLVFNPIKFICDWPNNVPGCS